VFGTSAKYLAMAEKQGLEPGRTHDLGALRAILSTGSPLAAHSYDYVYGHIGRDIHLASISGGTDIISCFALGNPIGPVWRGELQVRGLGMSVAILDDEGRPIAGIPGELCCTSPFPSMPVAFWNDPDGSAYRAAYFERFPGVWRHGDWAELAASASAPRRSTGRSSSCRRSWRASWWDRNGRATCVSSSSCACATGWHSTTRCASGSAGASVRRRARTTCRAGSSR
jgi:hypothetical protein